MTLLLINVVTVLDKVMKLISINVITFFNFNVFDVMTLRLINVVTVLDKVMTLINMCRLFFGTVFLCSMQGFVTLCFSLRYAVTL
jgi:hypothetical protein